jgi:uroporphyrinogen decarboxylase
MNAMTGKERISRILQHKSVDRIGLFEHFWGDTMKKWQGQGNLRQDENLSDHFGFDIENSWPLKMTAKVDFKNEVVEEDAETILERDGNGALLRRHKLHNATPEHVDFMVKERSAWEEHIKPLLTPTRNRINFEHYRDVRKHAAEKNRYFNWSGVNVFELMHPVCGHEHMLVGMAMDPDWIKDMADTYAQLTIDLMEILFSEEGQPDGIWFYEDMGFKERPFFSLNMYRELVGPAHKKTIDYVHSRGMRVIMHSCGFVEPLVPGMIESGVDCLQVIEVKAGMDLLKLKRDYGDKLAFCGGMDARNLVSNNLKAIKAELEEKIPVVKSGSGYILHSDHSIPEVCKYETYRYFVDEGLKLGTY